MKSQNICIKRSKIFALFSLILGLIGIAVIVIPFAVDANSRNPNLGLNLGIASGGVAVLYFAAFCWLSKVELKDGQIFYRTRLLTINSISLDSFKGFDVSTNARGRKFLVFKYIKSGKPRKFSLAATIYKASDLKMLIASIEDSKGLNSNKTE